MNGADIFIGVSSPDIVDIDMLKSMNTDPIVFALSNPVPEVDPATAEPYVKIMASGRSDYQNQINNVLCFPGFFKGLLNCHAKSINTEMELAAAQAIATVIKPSELHEDYIIPSVFDKRVVDRVESGGNQRRLLYRFGKEKGQGVLSHITSRAVMLKTSGEDF